MPWHNLPPLQLRGSVVAGPHILSSITQSPFTFAFPMLHSEQCANKFNPKLGLLEKARHGASLSCWQCPSQSCHSRDIWGEDRTGFSGCSLCFGGPDALQPCTRSWVDREKVSTAPLPKKPDLFPGITHSTLKKIFTEFTFTSRPPSSPGALRAALLPVLHPPVSPALPQCLPLCENNVCSPSRMGRLEMKRGCPPPHPSPALHWAAAGERGIPAGMLMAGDKYSCAGTEEGKRTVS